MSGNDTPLETIFYAEKLDGVWAVKEYTIERRGAACVILPRIEGLYCIPGRLCGSTPEEAISKREADNAIERAEIHRQIKFLLGRLEVFN